MTHVTSAIIVGGGIGGAATALSLARQGIKVMLLEKAHEIGEIGAGIQLGPNAFSALDSLGVGDVARQRAVFYRSHYHDGCRECRRSGMH
ncbi:3-hydroxybenzoate 6-hydroxylase [Salmonella enterica subsp. enterica serovar Daytona]|uniref:3-hydroxybenzoate 6-hydroxylase n=1 Tax=Salmonella enterica subsp. enterica serovar Daytona TaxID=1962639 RepID=A0A447JFN1_SALET|nr:3-hydroxybenzoate 6-hydroxylase [Salmonella enterica subsp. enterica serovar Daytona]